MQPLVDRCALDMKLKMQKERSAMVEMMKKLYSYRWIVLVIMLILPGTVLSGCRGNSYFDGSKSGDSDHFDIDFNMLNRSYSHTFEMKAGEDIEVTVAREEGKISIDIQKDDDDPIYRGNDLDTSNFRVTVKEDGTYKVQVTGDNARGHVVFLRHAFLDPTAVLSDETPEPTTVPDTIAESGPTAAHGPTTTPEAATAPVQTITTTPDPAAPEEPTATPEPSMAAEPSVVPDPTKAPAISDNSPKGLLLSNFEPTEQHGVYTTSKLTIPAISEDYEEYEYVTVQRFGDKLAKIYRKFPYDNCESVTLTTYDPVELKEIDSLTIAKESDVSYFEETIRNGKYLLVSKMSDKSDDTPEKRRYTLYDSELDKVADFTLYDPYLYLMPVYDEKNSLFFFGANSTGLEFGSDTIFTYDHKTEELKKIFDLDTIDLPEDRCDVFVGSYKYTDNNELYIYVSYADPENYIEVYELLYKIDINSGEITPLPALPHMLSYAYTDADIAKECFEPGGNRSIFSYHDRIEIYDADGKLSREITITTYEDEYENYTEARSYIADWKNNVVITKDRTNEKFDTFHCFSMDTGKLISECVIKGVPHTTDEYYAVPGDFAVPDCENGLLYIPGISGENSTDSGMTLYAWDYLSK